MLTPYAWSRSEPARLAFSAISSPPCLVRLPKVTIPICTSPACCTSMSMVASSVAYTAAPNSPSWMTTELSAMVALPANRRKSRLVGTAALMNDQRRRLIAGVEIQAGLAISFALADGDRIHDDRKRPREVLVIVGFISLGEAQVSRPARMKPDRREMEGDGMRACSGVRDVDCRPTRRERKLASPRVVIQVLDVMSDAGGNPAGKVSVVKSRTAWPSTKSASSSNVIMSVPAFAVKVTRCLRP